MAIAAAAAQDQVSVGGCTHCIVIVVVVSLLVIIIFVVIFVVILIIIIVVFILAIVDLCTLVRVGVVGSRCGLRRGGGNTGRASARGNRSPPTEQAKSEWW